MVPRVFVLVALAAMLNIPAVTPLTTDNTTTVGDFFINRYPIRFYDFSLNAVKVLLKRQEVNVRSKYDDFPVKEVFPPLWHEILQYFGNVPFNIISVFASDLSDTTLQSIYDDLNDNCGEYLDRPIESFEDEPSNKTCVTFHLRKTLKFKLKKDIDLAMWHFSHLCDKQVLPLCQKVPGKCTKDYDEAMTKQISDYVEDNIKIAGYRGSTPLNIILQFLGNALNTVVVPYSSTYGLMTLTVYHLSIVPSSIEPFAIGNLIAPKTFKETLTRHLREYTTTQSQQQLTWGIVRSDEGKLGHVCSTYKEMYSQDSEEYLKLLFACNYINTTKIITDVLSCIYANSTSPPLTWSSVPSVYFHSQCLCLLYNGTNCGVKAPQGVGSLSYCSSLVLRDFQRQISYRPAVTYLDYAFKTKVLVCQFINLLQASIQTTCHEFKYNFNMALSVQCYFKGLVNKQLNCSERMVVDTYNQTVLCNLMEFVSLVLCDGGDADVDVPVPFYEAGDSTFVLFLTYGDVVVRVFTMVTFLACQQLRNLPGKLLIGYLVTSLLRLLVVRSTLDDMELAVRLDVATDVASTFCLFSYLHFITMSIRDLRPPNSISRDEARVLLLRYSLLGWVLPAALSVTFFWMDTVIDSRVSIGQLLLLLCNYLALFGNLCMFFVSFKIYYDVKNDVRDIKRGSSKRDDIIALFNFAIKTSVLSGAGITFRLIFTQIQGLEELLGYYHALSSLQGLLVFLLYGCNHEARDFWLQVFHSTLSRFRPRPQIAPTEMTLRS